MNQKIYAHEHVTIDLSGVKKDEDCRMDDKALALGEFQALAKRKVCTVIDQTARGMGRNIAYAQDIAKQTGIKVLYATGYYKEPFLPAECYEKTERELAKIMVSELVDGIEDSGIKANHIGEIGTSKDCIHDIERKVFASACRAHSETGAPICTHSTLGTLGFEQIEIFRAFQVALNKVVISHIDLSGDYEYMVRLLETGVNIGFDTIGKENYMPDAKRIAWLNKLCEQGFSKQIVLSMDITRKSNCAGRNGIGYAFLIDSFVPALLKSGFDETYLSDILYNNACRIYGV